MRTNREAFAVEDVEQNQELDEGRSEEKRQHESNQQSQSKTTKTTSITRIKNVYGEAPYSYIYRFTADNEPEQVEQNVQARRAKKQSKYVVRTRNREQVIQRPKTPQEIIEAQPNRATEAEIVQMVEDGNAVIQETRFSNGQLVYQVKINNSDGSIWLNARAFMQLNPNLLLRHFQQQMQ